MFSAIYYEKEVLRYERARQILERFRYLPQIECLRYGDVFNRKAQNFRLQKTKPALILAVKHGKLILPVPDGYGFDSNPGYYFSHMLNCVYDCRYCFLQGMYSSANYVLFVNFEDFASQIELFAEEAARDGTSINFYSGYDCDSLALEPVSQFVNFFLPLFERLDNATLEIRTKSTQVRSFLEHEALANCITAMSFSSEDSYQRWEHKVPSIEKRLTSLKRLQEQNWPVALRFEPIICEPNSLAQYQSLFDKIFSELDAEKLHSVSLGEFRMPQDFHKRIVKLYPEEELFARSITVDGGMVALAENQSKTQLVFSNSSASRQLSEKELLTALQVKLFEYISHKQYYRCG